MNRTAGDYPSGRPGGFPAQSPTTVQYNLGGSARQVPGLAIQRRAVSPLRPIVGGTRRAASFRHPPTRCRVARFCCHPGWVGSTASDPPATRAPLGFGSRQTPRTPHGEQPDAEWSQDDRILQGTACPGCRTHHSAAVCMPTTRCRSPQQGPRARHRARRNDERCQAAACRVAGCR